MLSFKEFIKLEDAKIVHAKFGDVGILKDNGKFVSTNHKIKSGKLPKGSIVQHQEPISMRLTNLKLKKIPWQIFLDFL